MPIEVRIKSRKSTRRFRQIQLMISACLALIIGRFTIVYTIQQDAIARAYLEKSRIAAQTLHQQSVYDTYIDDLSKQLIRIRPNPRSRNENWEQVKQHIRVKTWSALPQVNFDPRKSILLFLYDNQLIRSNPSSDLINLNGADFSNVRFVNDDSCYLVNLSLTNIFANHIEFNGCNLEYADFSGSRMIGAKFINSRMGRVKFVEANLTNTLFQKSNTAGLWLHNAVLVHSRFLKSPQNIKFMNTDLYNNDWNKEQVVKYTFNQQTNSVINTRFSDGTFSDIDPKQLIKDGGAENECGQEVDTFLYNEPRPGWRQDLRYLNVSLINGTYPPSIEGHCYFYCPLNKSELEQAINVRNYSLLIDANSAYFNLSAFFSGPSGVGQVYVEITFYTDKLIKADDSVGEICK